MDVCDGIAVTLTSTPLIGLVIFHWSPDPI